MNLPKYILNQPGTWIAIAFSVTVIFGFSLYDSLQAGRVVVNMVTVWGSLALFAAITVGNTVDYLKNHKRKNK